ncbi:MAG: hypothetical protein PHW01_00790 [Patescibacteria group bacterium]|nr:hypothetical protein [Patescibacteria group bacterium]
MQKWLLILCFAAVVMFCFKLNTAIQEEEFRSRNLLNKMLDLTEDASRYVKPTEGDWKYFSDLGWAFMPTDGKNWAYWRDKQEKAQFFTLLDLALYKNQNNFYLRPFQYRKAYAFNPVSIDRKEIQKVDNIQNEYGRIWIEVQEPGRLVFIGLTKPLKFRQPRKLHLEISNHYLIERTKESGAFYWKPVGKLSTKTEAEIQ